MPLSGLLKLVHPRSTLWIFIPNRSAVLRCSAASSGVTFHFLDSIPSNPAAFQSVTTRTAGFNTVATDTLTPGSQFLSILLMFVGASPGSTGGGIKTTTFAMLLLAVLAIVRNREGVESFGRTIAGDIINKAITVIILAGFVVAAATVALLVLESSHDWTFLQVFFEVMSAFGTVGLSLGITSKLTVTAKLLLCLVMLVGRIGPLTLVLAISQQGPKPAYEYPRGTVMVG